MTKHAGKNRQQHGMLKAALLTGSIFATFGGTYLLGVQEHTASAADISSDKPAIVLTAPSKTSVLRLPPSSQQNQVQLNPVPQVIRPQINPVARTRSSR
jgi:hypothetical protein